MLKTTKKSAAPSLPPTSPTFWKGGSLRVWIIMDDSHGAWLSRICLIEYAILGSFLSKTLWIYLWLAFDDVWWSSMDKLRWSLSCLKNRQFLRSSQNKPSLWHQRFKCQSESQVSQNCMFRIWSFCVWVCLSVCFVSYVVSRLSLADGAILPVGINTRWEERERRKNSWKFKPISYQPISILLKLSMVIVQLFYQHYLLQQRKIPQSCIVMC